MADWAMVELTAVYVYLQFSFVAWIMEQQELQNNM